MRATVSTEMAALGFTLGIFGGDIAAKLAVVALGGAIVEAVVGSWVKDMAGRLKELPVEDDGERAEGLDCSHD